MAYYESIWIARQDISTQQVEELAAQLGQILTERGGEIASQEYWGLKNLSYRIKKNRKGHYVLFNLNAPADAVQEYERVMRLNEDVMRYLTVRVPELSSEPSAMLRDRGER
ncbi:MAG: 30S ribosomal protein S6, partial [Tistlia sp.]